MHHANPSGGGAISVPGDGLPGTEKFCNGTMTDRVPVSLDELLYPPETADVSHIPLANVRAFVALRPERAFHLEVDHAGKAYSDAPGRVLLIG